LIETLNIGNKSILVTSRFEEAPIRARCEKVGVKLIPKGMASLVPIEFEAQEIRYDACLIDDDPLVRMTWELSAKEADSSILTFDSFESFGINAEHISKETPISVDMNLGSGVQGTEVVLKLHRMGYKWIYLATGYEPEGIEDVPSCVVAVRGKDPMFAPNKITTITLQDGLRIF
jgi:hypothetical protein